MIMVCSWESSYLPTTNDGFLLGSVSAAAVGMLHSTNPTETKTRGDRPRPLALFAGSAWRRTLEGFFLSKALKKFLRGNKRRCALCRTFVVSSCSRETTFVRVYNLTISDKYLFPPFLFVHAQRSRHIICCVLAIPHSQISEP